MNSLLLQILDPIFGRPRGVPGLIGGAIMQRGNAEQEAWAVEHAELSPGMQVLEVGPGPGIGLALAAEAVAPGGRAIGVDPSRTMRAMARERCALHLAVGHATLREGTADDTGLPDASVDAVISVNNVTLWDQQAAYTEIQRVLRPGGRLVIVHHRHTMNTTPEQLHEELGKAGFEEVSLDVRGRSLNRAAVGILARRPA
ncbi:methyltransferase domain-containing protein [Streptomyces sp. HUCO-GS316]|uniref:class I SAM-dependent methyltransferase n=1 Tax=Streptomyces sp. HUCO-GS316 TaxID=2692198 RepID=UPI00136D7DEB|nr:methyltransferase domain-containing protein [Streptomyces sp. HUCO-GS316]MXM68993.1 methyltransferase domain-containing protein [Streptomyces sp. HUCO-GS316]